MNDPGQQTEERVWVHDRKWRVLVPGEVHRCRHRGCQNAAVAELRRPARGNNGKRFYQRWRYCAEHCFDRRIEGDCVLTDVHPESAAAERGWVD